MSDTNSFSKKLLDWSQVAASLATVATAYFAFQTVQQAIKSEAENEADAKLRQQLETANIEHRISPYPVFQHMSNYVALIPSPQGGMSFSDSQPTDRANGVPTIRNFGLGAALNVSIEFTVTKINRNEVTPQSNTVVVIPMHIVPDGTAYAHAIPECFESDVDRKIKDVQGTVSIICDRIDGRKVRLQQGFSATPNYSAAPPTMYFNFRGPTFLSLLDAL